MRRKTLAHANFASLPFQLDEVEDVGFLHYSLDNFERPEREQACIEFDHYWLTRQVATLEAVYLSSSSDPDFKLQEGERSRTERSDGLSQYR